LNLSGRLFFTSDTHFFHYNIIKYCDRPFATVLEMNQTLIDEWNAVVSPDDTIFHLGDFSMCPKSSVVEILSQLNGHKHLITGNHDGQRVESVDLWESVCRTMTLQIEDISIQLNHYPNFDKFTDWDIFLYGHVHNRLDPTHNTLDVGVDSAFRHFGKYRPFSLEDIVNIVSEYEDDRQYNNVLG